MERKLHKLQAFSREDKDIIYKLQEKLTKTENIAHNAKSTQIQFSNLY